MCLQCLVQVCVLLAIAERWRRPLCRSPAFVLPRQPAALLPEVVVRAIVVERYLSGGEQQMLAIGRALMSNPDLILMDEPSEGLSPRFVLHVGEIMKRMRALGHSILLVEQNLALALSVADYVYIISSGKFVFSGTPAQLSQEPDILDEHLGVSGSKTLPASLAMGH